MPTHFFPLKNEQILILMVLLLLDLVHRHQIYPWISVKCLLWFSKSTMVNYTIFQSERKLQASYYYFYVLVLNLVKKTLILHNWDVPNM